MASVAFTTFSPFDLQLRRLYSVVWIGGTACCCAFRPRHAEVGKHHCEQGHKLPQCGSPDNEALPTVAGSPIAKNKALDAASLCGRPTRALMHIADSSRLSRLRVGDWALGSLGEIGTAAEGHSRHDPFESLLTPPPVRHHALQEFVESSVVMWFSNVAQFVCDHVIDSVDRSFDETTIEQKAPSR